MNVSVSDLKTAYDADNINKDSIKESMADMMNALVKTDKTADTIGNERMGEDFVYSALVLDQLKKTNPSLAKKFADQVKKAYKQLYNKKTREAAPLLKAVNQVLQKFVDAGKLAKKVCTTIKNVAFGKSQLDSKTANQKRKPTVIDKDKDKNNVEEVLDKIAGNSIATKKEVKKEEKKFEGKVESEKTYKRKKKFLNGLKTDPVEKPAEKKEPEPTPPSNDVKVDETDFIGGTDDVGFRPEATDGKVSIVFPEIYSKGMNEVTQVEIVDSDGNILATGKPSDEEGDGRKIFRFDVTKDQLPTAITIRFRVKNSVTWIERGFRMDGDTEVDLNSIDNWI